MRVYKLAASVLSVSFAATVFAEDDRTSAVQAYTEKRFAINLKDIYPAGDGHWMVMDYNEHGELRDQQDDHLFKGLMMALHSFEYKRPERDPEDIHLDRKERDAGRASVIARILDCWKPENVFAGDLSPMEGTRLYPMHVKQLRLLSWMALYANNEDEKIKAQKFLIDMVFTYLADDWNGREYENAYWNVPLSIRRLDPTVDGNSPQPPLDTEVYAAIGESLRTSIRENQDLKVQRILSLFENDDKPSTFARRFVTDTAPLLFQERDAIDPIRFLYRVLQTQVPLLTEQLLDRSLESLTYNVRHGWAGSDIARIFLFRREEDVIKLLQIDGLAAIALDSRAFDLRQFLRLHPDLRNAFIVTAIHRLEASEISYSREVARRFIARITEDDEGASMVAAIAKFILAKDPVFYATPEMAFTRGRFLNMDEGLVLRYGAVVYLSDRGLATIAQLESVLGEIERAPKTRRFEAAMIVLTRKIANLLGQRQVRMRPVLCQSAYN